MLRPPRSSRTANLSVDYAPPGEGREDQDNAYACEQGLTGTHLLLLLIVLLIKRVDLDGCRVSPPTGGVKHPRTQTSSSSGGA